MVEKNILEKGIGVGNTSILDTAMIKLSEFGVDEVSAKVGFNGSLISGSTKVVAAGVLSYLLPKGIIQNLNSGLMADGMTDIYVVAKKAIFGNKNESQGTNPNMRVI